MGCLESHCSRYVRCSAHEFVGSDYIDCGLSLLFWRHRLNISDVVKTDLLKEEPEQNLYNQYVVIDKQLEELLSKKDYTNAINKLNDVKPYLDNFFEKVMVMCEDENIKINRISLINYITEKFNSFVNLSSLQ